MPLAGPAISSTNSQPFRTDIAGDIGNKRVSQLDGLRSAVDPRGRRGAADAMSGHLSPQGGQWNLS